MCKILLNLGLSIEQIKHEVETLLDFAVRQGDLEMVESFIDRDASINGENSDKETLLICAARHGHTEICEFLINYDICANKEDHLKMLQSASYQKIEICKLLIEYGLDINPLEISEEEMKNDIVTWRETFGKKK